MGFQTNTDKVLKLLTDNPGQVIYRDTIAEVSGLTEDQVSISMQRFLRRRDDKIAREFDVVVRGRAWRYVPNRREEAAPEPAPRRQQRQPAHRLLNRPAPEFEPEVLMPEKPKAHPKGDQFTLVGRSGNGDIIVKDEKGTLFKVVPL